MAEDQNGSSVGRIAELLKRFSLADLLVFLASEGIGIPLCMAAGDTAIHEEWHPTLL